MSELAFSKPDIDSVIRLAAMDLLARREHSRQELIVKLCHRFSGEEASVENIVARLGKENLQSDQRFAEAFVSSRSARGQGPLRIQAELRQRGVSEALIEQVLAESGINWLELAKQVGARKYGGRPCSNYSEKAKRIRFLQYRGFAADDIRTVLDS